MGSSGGSEEGCESHLKSFVVICTVTHLQGETRGAIAFIIRGTGVVVECSLNSQSTVTILLKHI